MTTRIGVGSVTRKMRAALVLIAGLWPSLSPDVSAAQVPVRGTPAGVAPAIGMSMELGVVGATPYVEDGNGVTVRSGIGPFVGGVVSLRLDDRFALMSGLRVSGSALRVASSGRAWRAGSTWQGDVRLGIATTGIARAWISASALLARATGERNVVPFRAGRGSLWMWGGEIAGYAGIPGYARTSIFTAVGADRIAPQADAEPPLDAGWVGRFRLGVRHDVR